MTGQRGRPPVPGVDVKHGDQFGPWTVTEAGLRLWQTDKDPVGRHAARCICVCGAGARTFKVSKLPGLAELGPDCPGHKRGRPRSGPGLRVKPGDRFGAWTVTRTGVRLYDGYGAEVACACGQVTRKVPVYTLPALAAAAPGPACPGHGRGRRRKEPAINPDDRFGPWIVASTGLRISGGYAARCVCVCGEGARTIRVADLRRLAGFGAACPGHKRGPKPKPRTPAVRPPSPPRPAAQPPGPARPAASVSRPAAAKPSRPAAPPRPRRPPRPAPPRIPVSQIHAGLEIGDWRVLRDDLTRAGVTWLLIACTTCRHQRRTPRTMLAAGRGRPCKHDYPEDTPAAAAARAKPGQDRALRWMSENRPDGHVQAADLAAGLGISRDSAQRLLKGLADAGRITRPWHGAYALPGADIAVPDDARREKIILFLAADGGGIFAEIQRATGIGAGALTGFLATMTRCGDIIRVEDRARWFYLLPGQEPGERVEPPGAAS